MLENWRIWSRGVMKPQDRAALPPRPPSGGGDWSAANVAEQAAPNAVFATWLAELRGPNMATHVAAGQASPGREPTQDQLAALDEDPRVAPAPQVAWTESEAADMEGYVRIGFANNPRDMEVGLRKVSEFLAEL